ncbi:type II toxin-antitoxin system RelE family toxin [Euzebyella saccharophila]|uniref:Type II toxin-antitoxin system RelE/ParE family toxin n=1 Tax=Euzebyella saccharophila TaxID=679664 RepID=A0ABV8JNT5_9FLAO|nr:plasmid stabilization protein [Euzebyella saccharophila]MDO1502620.1 plasmid stabilization protein [Winogradskyella maritima]
MEVVYLRSFLKDIKSIKDRNTKDKIKTLISDIKKAENLGDVNNVSKLRGYSFAYRARIGDYRLGMYHQGVTVELARFVKRNDIYKVFPK